MISCANVGTYCWFLAQFRVFVFWGGDGGIFILFLLRLLQSAMSVHFLSQLGLGLVNVFPCTDLPADFVVLLFVQCIMAQLSLSCMRYM